MLIAKNFLTREASYKHDPGERASAERGIDNTWPVTEAVGRDQEPGGAGGAAGGGGRVVLRRVDVSPVSIGSRGLRDPAGF